MLMSNLKMAAALLALATTLVFTGDVAAQRPPKTEAKDGGKVSGELKAVDAAKSSVTLSTCSRADGKSEKSYAVAKDAKILRDGKEAKLADLQAGNKATLTLSVDQKSVVSIVAGVPPMSALLKSVDAGKNTITVTVGGGRTEKQDKTYQVVKDAKITIEGKEGKLADLKEGATVTLAVAEGTVSVIQAKTAKGRPR